tara:strand:+ start:362 stop:610 length:249 start_codon:yes stop_codon:yes gene_type:complete
MVKREYQKSPSTLMEKKMKRNKITYSVVNGIAYKVEDGDLYYLDKINNKYEMVTYFEDFSELELYFLKRTLPKFNLYHGEYL